MAHAAARPTDDPGLRCRQRSHLGRRPADIYEALRLNQGCVGRGFFFVGSTCSGYGDPCTAASGGTGIRSVDFADRTTGLPHDLTWVRANCGTTVHFLGAAYSETVWDLLKRDLPTFPVIDNNTALEVTTRLPLHASA